MKKTRNPKKTASAESIAEMADAGQDVSPHFTNKGKMVSPIQRVNVDFTAGMLSELDETAEELNVSRQSVIKTLVQMGLNGRYLAPKSKKDGIRPYRDGSSTIDFGALGEAREPFPQSTESIPDSY